MARLSEVSKCHRSVCVPCWSRLPSTASTLTRDAR
jgi:hypothetical protein